jgi:membrane associated rhomboid family serine protease
MGKVKFIVFYLLGGLAALAGQTLVASGSGNAVPLVGASGAIAAVLGGYILLYPRARVLTVIFIVFFFTLIEIPAMLVLGIWFVQQILFGAYGLTAPAGGGGGVAYFAHIGGFVFGLLLIRVFAHRQNPAYNNGRPRSAVI